MILNIRLQPRVIDLFTNPGQPEPLGVLTDEHPQSSYGLPVLVMDGIPLGPANIPADYEIVISYDYIETGNPALYESDAEIKARRPPAQVALAQAAQQAGYRIANP